MNQLTQRTLFSKKEFTLGSTGVHVVSHSLRENLEYTVRYEDLGFDLVKRREKTALVPAILLSLFFFLEAYLLVDSIYHQQRPAEIIMWALSAAFFGVVAGMAFFQNNKDTVYLTGGAKVLEFSRHKPSTEAVETFIYHVHAQIRAFYKRKYGVIDPNLPQDVLWERFKWLQEIGVITQEELEDLYMQLQINDLLS
ncbi:hypothetical protein [Rufibacter psychrotolerans]|uniref:hypothetical protein n=1 Tax=Rufibacter psychrotolerans TaxID=2812556 RepID=UPI001966EDDA|nr:hypothetical protein [Rufibacter sp. SYSU D00308]